MKWRNVCVPWRSCALCVLLNGRCAWHYEGKTRRGIGGLPTHPGGPRAVEHRTQTNQLRLHAIGAKDGARMLMLSYTSYCREQSDPTQGHACIKVAFLDTEQNASVE